jgi:hypothetical protein
MVNITDPGYRASILAGMEAETIQASVRGGMSSMAIPAVLGVDSADITVSEVDTIDIECKDLLKVGCIGAIVLDQKDLRRFPAGRFEEPLMIRHHIACQIVRSDQFTAGTRVLEHYRIAGTGTQNGFQVTLSAFGYIFGKSFYEWWIADEIHQELCHATQLGSYKKGGYNHSDDEEILA